MSGQAFLIEENASGNDVLDCAMRAKFLDFLAKFDIILMKGTMKMKKGNKKENDKNRYALRFRYWSEKEGRIILEISMTTSSLRKARSEFRNQLGITVSAEIEPNVLKEIVKAGYVVAAGSFLMGADRFAMTLTDTLKPNEMPPMFAFTDTGDNWIVQRFNPPAAE